MIKCDICSNSTVGKYSNVVSSDLLREAVTNGFNPYKLGLAANVGDSLGIPPTFMFTQWKNRLMSDTTGWNLCSDCEIKVNEYFSSKSQVGQLKSNKLKNILSKLFRK